MAKKKSESPPARDGTLLDRLTETVGKRPITFRPASEVVSTYSLRRPTGILSLDLALRGGVPAGTVVQLFGPDGVGKDYIFNSMAAQVQQNYGKQSRIFIASFGYSWDKTAMLMAGMSIPFCDELAEEGIGPDHPKYGKLLKKLGDLVSVDVDRANLKPNDDLGPAECLLAGVIACIATGEFQMGLINELPAAETQWHADLELGADSRPGSLAKVMADFQRKYFEAMKKLAGNETTLVVINQARANIGAPAFASQITEPCGFALKHMKAVDIHLRIVGRVKQGDRVIGKEVSFQIPKGKCGLGEGGQGTFDFLFYEGADVLKDLLVVCTGLGLVHKAGAWYSHSDGTRMGQGIEETKKLLADRPDLVRELKLKAYVAHGLEGKRVK